MMKVFPRDLYRSNRWNANAHEYPLDGSRYGCIPTVNPAPTVHSTVRPTPHWYRNQRDSLGLIAQHNQVIAERHYQKNKAAIR